METIIIHVENLDPVGKGRPRMRRSGSVYTPPKTAAFERALTTAARFQYFGPILEGPLAVFLDLKYRVPRSWPKKRKASAVFPGKPDIDNVAKSILDALNGVIFSDDSQVSDLHVRKRYAEIPSISIMICEAG